MKGEWHDKNTNPKIEELGALSGGQPTGKAVNPRLNPLIAPSRAVPAAEASHEGAAAETAAHLADEEDETLKGARELEAYRVAHNIQSLVRGMRARWRAQC